MSTSSLVKEPQQRQGKGFSVVYRCAASQLGGGPGLAYVKTQQDYCCRPVWRAWRRTPTLWREYRALRACQRHGIPVPEVLGYRVDSKVAELAVGEIANASPLIEALGDTSERVRGRILRRVARVVAMLHNTGWTHGALGSPHILVENDPKPRIWLIDLEKAKLNPFKRRADLQRLWRRSGYLSADDRETFMREYRSLRRRGHQAMNLALGSDG